MIVAGVKSLLDTLSQAARGAVATNFTAMTFATLVHPYGLR